MTHMETGRTCRVHTERPRIFFLLTVLTTETKIHDKNVHNIMLHFHLPVLASLMRCVKLSRIMTELYQNIGGYPCGIYLFFNFYCFCCSSHQREKLKYELNVWSKSRGV